MLGQRRAIVIVMVAIPIMVALFFIYLLGEGLPVRAPIGVVDMDRSELSRRVTRNLGANQMLRVQRHCDSYADAMAGVRSGELYGFFAIPEGFDRDAVGGRKPTVSFYCDVTYFVPGTLVFKGFKIVAVTTAGGLVQAQLAATGALSALGPGAQSLTVPVSFDQHLIGNPWMNYSYYLTTTFVPCALCLIVLLVTIYSITDEIKSGTSRQWLTAAGGSMLTALMGKLLPQTVVFWVLGAFIQAVLYGFCHFPLHCHPLLMLAAILLTVTATQCLAVLVCELLPNPRLALSVGGLVGILAFSIAGFSFPVENMYGGVAVFSYILPIRYYFLIHAAEAVNGAPFYYVRVWYGILALFPLIVFPLLGRLRRACLNPVYVP